MGRGDARNSPKMKSIRSRNRKKARLRRRLLEAKAAR